MSVLYQFNSIIIDRGISAHGHCKEVIGGLKSIDRRYMYQIISNFQHPGSKTFDSNILMHYCTQKNDVSLAKELQKHLYRDDQKHEVVHQGK